ncbi:MULTISPECIES: ATP-binding protein [unclassified Ectothiorhodospira]|uniref:ATP-binding protein n=1 Tax=unclassified Ectothiorhodospira TaxID=2684909 RepID=UPI001EE7BBDA|nr:MULTISPECIES: ATP-binding protein [unclassified Ectothiorhodospira]MCG5516407.1 ATP-binding protein [Ectothiorhodospira sp. 9100]MCG5519343.1 ATP-binding protein [Ectothiorhodospira sp. 9905]
MPRFFNNAGPTVPTDHYAIDPLSRIDWEELQALIEQKRYFVLHAPRQTGKTTTLLTMMAALNAQGRYACAYANIEAAQAARGDSTMGIRAACSAIGRSIALYLGNEGPDRWLTAHRDTSAQDLLARLLEAWAVDSDLPTVLFLDEVDALVGDTLISLLRQIRAGYPQRPGAFPQSIVLCGVRDVRDYRMHQEGAQVITGGSAFNIKAESLRMGNFTEAECRTLWQQHTDETGQVFDPAIFPELWEDTRGQPWLVNALGYELTWRFRPARDRSRALSLEDYRAAREALIQSRATHLDQLTDKLREPRVHAVMNALLSGQEEDLHGIQPDDQQYVADLGLIETHPQVRISNRIYREVIPRDLTWIMQTRIPNQEQQWYITPDGRLDTPKLLRAFQQFFREQADSWIERFDYKEAGPQLLMQAFLQRIVNGGGRISREYGLGRKRTDLFIEWPTDSALGFNGPMQRIVVELKLQRGTLETVVETGLAQTAAYADQVGADEAHLVIFNRDPAASWDARIWEMERIEVGRLIRVWGA